MVRAALKKLYAVCRISIRPVVSLLMIASLALVHVGYPVWEPTISTVGEAFPCQFGRCGCRTLEQCRTSCCCHSKQEKVDWALERGIDPDRVAVLTPAEKMHFSGQTKVAMVKKACTARTATSCCCSTSKSSACTAQRPTVGLTFVLAIAAQKCSGTGVEWIQAGFVAAAPQPVSIVFAVPETPLDDSEFASYLSPTSGHLLRPA